MKSQKNKLQCDSCVKCVCKQCCQHLLPGQQIATDVDHMILEADLVGKKNLKPDDWSIMMQSGGKYCIFGLFRTVACWQKFGRNLTMDSFSDDWHACGLRWNSVTQQCLSQDKDILTLFRIYYNYLLLAYWKILNLMFIKGTHYHVDTYRIYGLFV